MRSGANRPASLLVANLIHTLQRCDMAKHTAEKRTARFWQWHCGWVKISLRPGERYERCTGGPTDEGFSYTQEAWELADGEVWYSWESWGRDCDGRHESGGRLVCPVDRLASDEPYDSDGVASGIRVPDWQDGEKWQRDHTAEAAGY